MKKVVFALLIVCVSAQGLFSSDCGLTPVGKALQTRQAAGDLTFYSLLDYVADAGDLFNSSERCLIVEPGGVVIHRATFEKDLAAALSYRAC